MKILQINRSSGVFSTGTIASDIGNKLIENGHESYIAYGRYYRQNNSINIKIGNKFYLYLHAIQSIFFDREGYGSKKPTTNLLKKIDAINPDIIHLHNLHGYFINIWALFEYLKESNIPVVWTLHDCWSFTGSCAYFEFQGCERWRMQCYACPKKSIYFPTLIDNSKKNYQRKKEIFNTIKKMVIVTPSQWLSNLFRQSFLRKYKCKIIYNGIDLEKFRPRDSDFRDKNNLKNKFIILGIASKWSDRKGFRFFIDLSNNLKSDEVIVIVGLSEKQKKSLPNNIIGISRTRNIIELAEIYSASDILFNPTLEDNFPLVNLESLACGTPIITFKTGGSPESIDSDTGFIVNQGDLTMTRKYIDIIKKCGKYSFSTPCRQRATSMFNKNDRILDYIKLYSEIMLTNNNLRS